ncbi:MAG: hypothetical protein WBM99_13350, partial [Psychromonas sp.]
IVREKDDLKVAKESGNVQNIIVKGELAEKLERVIKKLSSPELNIALVAAIIPTPHWWNKWYGGSDCCCNPYRC